MNWLTHSIMPVVPTIYWLSLIRYYENMWLWKYVPEKHESYPYQQPSSKLFVNFAQFLSYFHEYLRFRRSSGLIELNFMMVSTATRVDLRITFSSWEIVSLQFQFAVAGCYCYGTFLRYQAILLPTLSRCNPRQHEKKSAKRMNTCDVFCMEFHSSFSSAYSLFIPRAHRSHI